MRKKANVPELSMKNMEKSLEHGYTHTVLRILYVATLRL